MSSKTSANICFLHSEEILDKWNCNKSATPTNKSRNCSDTHSTRTWSRDGLRVIPLRDFSVQIWTEILKLVGPNLDLRKNDYFIKNALPWRSVKISLIQANFDKLWPSLNLVRSAAIFSRFGTNTSKNTLVLKLENMVSVRTKIRLGHTFPKLTWIMEIFTLRHGNAFLIK